METEENESRPGSPRLVGLPGRLRGDLLGGFTVAIVALPLALAFGVASGVGAAAGLYGAIIGGFLASLLGGTPAQVSGPTGAMTVVLITVFRRHGLDTLFLAMALAGLIQILFGVLRLGRYIQFIPNPVVAGFTNGIALVIFLGQMDALKAGPIVGLVAAAAVFLAPRFTKAVPASLVALAAGTATMYLLHLDAPTIGAIPSGLPPFRLPRVSLESVWAALPPALTLSLLGSIESLLAAVIVDDLTQTYHDSDRELIGQGAANLVAPLFGGIAGTGAIVRSVVNVKAGGRTRLSGMFHAAVLLVIVLAFGRVASGIPLAALAGILMATAVGMVDYRSLSQLPLMPRTDALVQLVTTALTVATDLTVAVAAGLVMSALFFMYKMSRPVLHTAIQPLGGIQAKVCTPEGPLFFGAARHFLDGSTCEEGIAVAVLDLRLVPLIDATGCEAIERLYQRLSREGIRLLVTNPRPQPRAVLGRLGLLERCGRDSLPDAWREAAAGLSPAAPVG